MGGGGNETRYNQTKKKTENNSLSWRPSIYIDIYINVYVFYSNKEIQ